MIAAVDSSYARPSPASVAAFRGAGVKMWNGYLATKGGVNLAATWSQADFELARQLGADPIGYCSGWDDPVAVKKLAAAWRVKACLDDEGGIRSDGPWVQPFLDTSGAGLYGNPPVFAGRHAPFFVEAAYPGYDPGRTWPSGDPGVPCGWQWEGTHTEFGLSIDRGWFDDWFLQGDDMTPEEHAKLYQLDDVLRLLLFGEAPAYASASGNPAGWSAPGGKGHLTRAAEMMFANQGAILTNLGVEKAEVDAMLTAVKAPPAVDVEALATSIAAKLPPGGQSVDPALVKAVATAVVNEIGVRVRPV